MIIICCYNIYYRIIQSRQGSRGATVVRALASHQCCLGSIPGPHHQMQVEFVDGSRPFSKSFSLGSPAFLRFTKPTLLNSNSIKNLRATGLLVARLLCVTLIKEWRKKFHSIPFLIWDLAVFQMTLFLGRVWTFSGIAQCTWLVPCCNACYFFMATPVWWHCRKALDGWRCCAVQSTTLTSQA